jgi:phage-related protein
MREPQAKRLTHLKYPLWELRPMLERIFYAYWQDNQYIILHHYTKRQAKTDPQQVQHALRLLDDWISRKENEK